MSRRILGLPGNERLVEALSRGLAAEPGVLTVRQFPDGETYVRVETGVAGDEVVLACGLERPDSKALPLYLTAMTLRELGARRLILAAPYLAYMRQDHEFHAGEAVSARHFACWLSACVDGLVTVDPHLHRIHDLGEIYPIQARAVASAPTISRWLREHLPTAVLIGPDEESRQWVAEVARAADCPYLVLEKIRRGDRSVEVSVPDLSRWRDRTPVLVDDIISTAATMIAAVHHLRTEHSRPPVCIGVHAIFAGTAHQDLLTAGAERVVTCNTIPHVTNAIDVHGALVTGLSAVMGPAGIQPR